MTPHIRPGVHKIFGAQRRVGLQQFPFGCAKLSRLLEQPHGNSRSNDARLASAYVRPRVDSGDLRLLAPRKRGKQVLEIADCCHNL